MLDKLRSLFQPSSQENTALTIEVAVAALLVEMAMADGVFQAVEKAPMIEGLQTLFDMDSKTAAQTLEHGQQAQQQATGLHPFTKLVKTLPMDRKILLLETFWKIILSDDDRDHYEDSLMRQICGLLHLEDRESGLARQRVLSQSQSS